MKISTKNSSQITISLVLATIIGFTQASQMTGNDMDQNGCIGSAGYSWCPSLNQCIRPWETDCPTTPGHDDMDAHGCIDSAGYTWCHSLNQCIRPWETDCPTTPGSDMDEHGCIPSAGYTWCPSLNQCIRPWETDCPIAPGSDRDEHGCIPSAGYTWCASTQKCIRSWEEDCPSGSGSTGSYAGAARSQSEAKSAAAAVMPRSGTAQPVAEAAKTEGKTGGVAAMPGSGTDEHGCMKSAGFVWCDELQRCVQPWNEACPVQGQQFEGPSNIVCSSDMRCSLSDACTIDMGTYTIGGPYMTGISGTLSLPSGCTANCTGCEDDEAPIGGETDEHGCLVAAGQQWCESKKQCISLTEDCPVVNGEAFQGPTTIQCEDGACSINNDCRIDVGSFTIGGPYLSGLNGAFPLPSGCTADCTGCQTQQQANGGGRRLRGHSTN